MDQKLRQILETMRDDPVFFCQKILGFTPFPYQAKLMRSRSKRIAVCMGRQTGKTWCIAGKAVHFAFFNPGTTTLIVSRGLRQSMLMFRIISNFIWSSPILRRSVERSTQTEIHLRNGSKIVALPCSQDGHNLRGHTADMVIMDEASFMPESVIGDVIFPMLATTETTRGTGIAIMISTPWGREHIFYRCYNSPKWFTMHVPSTECPIITKEFLAEQRALIGELRFDTEYMAKFREDAMAMFTQDMIRGAMEENFYLGRLKQDFSHLYTDPELHALSGKFTGEHCMGIDIGKRIDYSVISIFKKAGRTIATDLSPELGRPLEELETERVDPAWMLVYQKKFPLGTLITAVVAHAIWLTTKFNIRFAAIDQTQIGEMPFEVIKSELSILQGVYFSAPKKQDVMMSYYLMVEQRRVGIPYSEKYEDNLTQMAEQQCGYGQAKPLSSRPPEEKGVMMYWHPSGRKDDRLISCALAIYSTIRRVKRMTSGVAR